MSTKTYYDLLADANVSYDEKYSMITGMQEMDLSYVITNAKDKEQMAYSLIWHIPGGAAVHENSYFNAVISYINSLASTSAPLRAAKRTTKAAKVAAPVVEEKAVEEKAVENSSAQPETEEK